ncbi:MAG: YbfB/YjiJ family MFS transporter [Streptosporangiales bacterium]|nr:YbfB/YjiJ family MFS transporter [Streptosporangiales bacterium]
MKTQLHWSFATAGGVNTANAIGYLAGSLLAARIAARFGSRRTFVGSFLVTGGSLLGCALTTSLLPLLLLRAVSGFSGAATFVVGAGLLVQTVSARGGAGPLPMAVYSAGTGTGIAASGLTVPVLLAALSDSVGWRVAWALLGVLTFAALLAVLPAARRTVEPPPAPVRTGDSWPAAKLVPALLAYSLFGVGCIAYLTFIVAFLQHEGVGTVGVAGFWCLLGLAGVVGPLCWSPVLRRLGHSARTAAVLGVLAVGAGIPLLTQSAVAGLVSTILFGTSFLMVVAVFTDIARAQLAPHQWTPAIGGLTVAFATGQSAGPVLAGLLADTAGGIELGLAVSTGVLFVAAGVSLAQRPAPR